MELSILVVSRTSSLLNRLLAHLPAALSLPSDSAEILCSWNGTAADRNKLVNESKYPLQIIDQPKYHFAENVNTLSRLSTAKYLLIINDDLIPDPHALDAGLACIKAFPNAGVVGARLRMTNGLLSHDGVGFTNTFHPYNLFEGLIPANSHLLGDVSHICPAVIGALMLVERHTFSSITFNEAYRDHGEDTHFCLALKMLKGLQAVVCPQCSGVHNPSSTRKHFGSTVNLDDVQRLSSFYKNYLQSLSKSRLIDDFDSLNREAHIIRSFLSDSRPDSNDLRKEIHQLHLNRLKLEQEIRSQRQRPQLTGGSK